MESIYGTVNYTSSSTLLNNASIKVANDVSYFVHNSLQTTGTVVNSKLDFLWIPYYGYTTTNINAATVIKNIGYVVSRTTIFDIVIIQPAYYYYYLGTSGNYTEKQESDSVLITNLDSVVSSVKNSSNNGCVAYRNGVKVIARENYATAIVGFEMEIDDRYEPEFNPSKPRYKKALRYNSYVNKFKSLRSSTMPMCYYAGAKQSLVNNISTINNFYSGSNSNLF